MELSNHKIFFREEFFGSIIYNTKDKNYYFFDKDSSDALGKIFNDNYENNPELNKFKNELIENGLLTSDIFFIKNKKNKGLSSPLRVFIDITHKCNLKCKHCFTDSGRHNPQELTTENIFRLIDQMREGGTFLLSIAGGEPLLRSDIFQIIKYARKNFIDVSITTNGLLIDKEKSLNFDKLGMRTITVSIDGMGKTHDQIRGLGNFNKAIEKIKILRKYCKTAALAIKTTLNSLNIGEYKELINLAKKLSLDSIKFNPIRLFGRTKDNQYLLINQNQYIDFLKNVRMVKTNIEVTLPKTPLDKRDYDFVYCGFGCTGGKETCNVSPSGDFSSCAFLGENFVVGNIKKEKFFDLWEKTKKSVSFQGNETCNNCPEYKNCRGGCRNRALFYYKNIDAVDPFCVLKKNDQDKKLTIRKEKNNFIVYDHFLKTYSRFNDFREIENNYKSSIKNKQYRIIENKYKVPFKIFFDVTNKCNSRCIHCYNDSGTSKVEEMDLITINNLAAEMSELGIFQISISGGEPFVRKEIFEIIKIFNQNGIDVSITTNGLNLTKDKVNCLTKLDIDSITVSIDGINKNKYKDIRGVDGFNALNGNIDYLRKKFKGKLSMRFSVMKDNCEPEKVIEYAVAKKFDCLKINKTHLLGRFNKNRQYLISDEEYDSLINKFDKLKDKYQIQIELPREKYLNIKKKLPCSAGEKTIYINSEGKIFPCPFIPRNYLFGDFKKESLREVLSKNISFSVDNPFCRKCPAMKRSQNMTKNKLIYNN
jgi:radical SAM protein with 4Fe4S-binding SPASM domain